MKKIILTISIVLLSTSVRVQSSESAPRLSLRDVRGRALNLSDYRGRVVLINFWATWCPPCRTEIPDLIKMQSEYRQQGLRIIGVTYPPEKISNVRRFMRRMGVNYKIAVGTKAS